MTQFSDFHTGWSIIELKSYYFNNFVFQYLPMEEIVNRVAKSNLITIDLEEFHPKGKRHILDISHWLKEGKILIEKEFRKELSSHNWKQYVDGYLAITCSNEAIVPAWAYLLITTHSSVYAKKTIVGDLNQLERTLFQEIISALDITLYQDQRIVVKGCSSKTIPENAYVQLIEKIRPVAKSIMYGEPCSTVPLYKRK